MDVNQKIADSRIGMDNYVKNNSIDLKIAEAAGRYADFMDVILPGWREDPNCADTPKRVAKMFINELLAGVYGDKPKITSFDNLSGYDGMVFQGDIDVKSMCSHHHMPFVGKAFVAYIPAEDGKIIGLSKLNRVVEYYSRRAQVQENLTMQIHNAVKDVVGDNKGIAVFIRANHLCVSHRGAKNNSEMKTSKLTGLFFTDNKAREEFYELIRNSK